MKTVFLRALEADDKAAALLEAIREPELAQGKLRFEVEPASFASVPCSPFPYWMSDRLRSVFGKVPSLETGGHAARQGLASADDFRWLRLWWEAFTHREGRYWTPFTKGGAHSSYYSDLPLTVAWGASGRDIKEWKADKLRMKLITANNSKCWNESHYFRPGLTWSQRSQLGLSLRIMPAQCIFGKNGPAVFSKNNDTTQLIALLAITNSMIFQAFVSMQMAFGSFEVGVIQRTPVPNITAADRSTIATLARRAWSLKRRLDARTETSHAFTLPALLQVPGDTLTANAAAWVEHIHAIETKLATIQAEIDVRCFDLYGIDEADRRAITEGFGSIKPSAGTAEADPDADAESDSEADDEDEVESGADTTSLAAELVSWAVGVAFGRFDVRLATGAQSLPPEPGPFAPLPVCSPAMLTGEDGLPLVSAPTGYPLAFPESGILVDDPGHRHDLTAAVRAVFDLVFGARTDVIWLEASALLDPKDHDLRAWLATDFFEHHIKRYSKSRRKAPILWQLGVPSGRYSVWLYAHRLTRDSFFQLQNDVVATKLAHEERQLTTLVQHAGGSPSAKVRKEITAQEIFVEELRALLEEVRRVASLWNPTLDDGMVLIMAPLWRLVPQHKPWQKKLKGKWDELCANKYDWAHLAMHLWPERVVCKCATDRSLAIAHGLEDVFWVEDTAGKWQPRSTPARPVEEIVREHSSLAVKAALKNLLDPQVATGGTSSKKRKGSPS